MSSYHLESLLCLLTRIPNVKKVLDVVNNKIYKIIYQDDFAINIELSSDPTHHFYTFLDNIFPEYHYTGKVPYDSIDDLYYELLRMNSINTRSCKRRKYPYK